jgi:hypothetical protein
MTNEFFRSVTALPDYMLEVLMGTGALIRFDFRTHLHTVRFSPLRDLTLFQSAKTDGSCLFFDCGADGAVKITASEFMDLVLVNRARIDKRSTNI